MDENPRHALHYVYRSVHKREAEREGQVGRSSV